MPLLYESYTAMQMQKKQTWMRCYLRDEAGTTPMEGKTVSVGTKIMVRSALYQAWDAVHTGLDGKRHIQYHRKNTAPYEKIADAVAIYNFVETIYTLSEKGTHTFYAEFPGDAEWEASKSPEVMIGVGVAPTAPLPFPKEYLIGGALAVAGLVFVGLALKRRK